MKTQPIEIDLKTLMREIHLYLAAVDAFRAAGYPPRPHCLKRRWLDPAPR